MTFKPSSMPPADLDLEAELRRDEFRVSIFGSARPKPDAPVYQDTFALAKAIAEKGWDLVTGGGPGLMEAASLGHKEGDTEEKAHSIGLNIRLPFEQKYNEGLDMMEMHERFSTRLDDFMMLSNAVVVMPGGVGTALEFFYTWQLIQVNHICSIPVIMVGDMWRALIEWVIDHPLKNKYLNAEDLNSIVIVDSWEEALQALERAKEAFDRKGPNACLNWKKYGGKGLDHEHDED